MIITRAGTFVGCSDDEGDGDSSGSKYDLTFWADATQDATTEANASYLYKRAFKQLGSKEKVSAFTATVTVDLTKYSCTLSKTGTDEDKYYQNEDGNEIKHSNIALMFDFHQTKDESNNKVYDAVVVGYRPYDKGFFVEHWANISGADFSDADGGAFTAKTSLVETSNTKYITQSQSGYVTTLASQVTRNESAKTDTFTLTVEQSTPGTYTIKIGSQTVGTYTRAATDNDDGTTLRGGLAAYANAAVGTLAKATFTTGKENITGSLFDETVEE